MKQLKRTVLFLSLSLISFNVGAQTSPLEMVDRIGRGLNLGNTLSAPFEGNWAPAVEETYFQDIAAVGFTAVRIPIRFDMHTTALGDINYTDGSNNYVGTPADYSVDESYLDRIEQVTDWALENGLVAIIDVHGDHWFWESYDASSPEYKTGPDRLAAEDRFRAIWRDISVRFQNKSENLLFEIMNEAYFSMSASEVNYINSEILSIIRLTNATRNVIVNGGGINSWQAPLQLPRSFLNSDDYLIATFHYYRPFSFTSSSKQQHNDFDWGTQNDKDSVDDDFDAVYNWAQPLPGEDEPIAVLLGEFGADNVCGFNYDDGVCGDYGGPDAASRVAYHEYLAEAAISRGFSFTAWDAGHKSNKTIYRVDNRGWVIDVRNALLGIDCIDSGIISNADIECGYDSDWDLFVQAPAEATNSNAPLAESRNSSTTMQVDVTTAGDAFNRTILRNLTIEDASLSGKLLNFSCYAKASTGSQQFKIRLKAIVNGTITELTASPNIDLTTDFEYYEFQYQVPLNLTSLQLHVLCGKQAGTYYFDDFSVDDQTLSTEISQDGTAELLLYPNPANSILNYKSAVPVEKVEAYNLNGQKIQLSHSEGQIDVLSLSNGLYFMKLISSNGNVSNHKILINHNQY